MPDVMNGDSVTICGKTYSIGEVIDVSFDDVSKCYVITFEDTKGFFRKGVVK